MVHLSVYPDYVEYAHGFGSCFGCSSSSMWPRLLWPSPHVTVHIDSSVAHVVAFAVANYSEFVAVKFA
jgi:hypothetical protein|eukprot:SAG25_NODE_438_length_8018_cov_7.819800_2_plen_68_part_00